MVIITAGLLLNLPDMWTFVLGLCLASCSWREAATGTVRRFIFTMKLDRYGAESVRYTLYCCWQVKRKSFALVGATGVKNLVAL